MVMQRLVRVFGGDPHKREIEKLSLVVEEINQFEERFEALSNDALREKTSEFKQRLAGGETLDDLLPEAFAAVREASKRTLGMRHYDIQMIGGMTLHTGKIAEMRTGEGKTLVATLPLYLNALTGRGVHLVTVNDSLARRDARWMAPVYHLLGLKVGVLQMAARTENGQKAFLVDLDRPNAHEDLHLLNLVNRAEAYKADIVYGTNSEFGFDYLRDNLTMSLAERVQRGHYFSIVDEVDNILIDEARTPLIISGPAADESEGYQSMSQVVRALNPEDYEVNEKDHQVSLTEIGEAHVEEILNQPLRDPDRPEDVTPEQARLMGYLEQALRAQHLYRRNKDYIVQSGKVIIVDEFTGRLMPGRRWSEGLHQAVEAKEGVKIEPESVTYATITIQNYFRMYEKLAGMTGTADTEATEFKKIYNLDVVVIPTNMPMIRIDYSDVIYKTEEEKFEAAIEEIKALHALKRPVLVGTISIEKSELLSKQLSKRGIKHNVLNAKNHEKEAEIIAQAGQPGAVTISTNMAGRGTDIKLGEGVADVGGLHILGTERHESRRIDNQLRGRSGRQGDKGSSRFYLSLEDDLLRIFGAERISSVMDRIGVERGEPIEHNLISKAIESAQKRVEGQNFEIRKHLIEYDDVMNRQRQVIYEQRRNVLDGDDLWSTVNDMLQEIVEDLVSDFLDEKVRPDEWDLQGLSDAVYKQFYLRLPFDEAARSNMNREEVTERIIADVTTLLRDKEKRFGVDLMKYIMRVIMLQAIDFHWKDHLLGMDHLKEGIGLRGYGQKDPVREYQKEGYDMFMEMVYRIKEDTLQKLCIVQIQSNEEVRQIEEKQKTDYVLSRGDGGTAPATVKRTGEKIGRNAPCPCGSGKKYKHCCGR